MTIEELKAAIEADPEMKKAIRSMITFEDILKDETLGKQILSYKDSEVSKAVDSFQKNTLPKKLEEELKKKEQASAKPEWQIEIDNLKAELAKKEQEAIRSSQKARALKIASEKGLPSDILDYFLGSSDEETDQKLTTLSKTFEDYSSKIKQEVLKNHNISVPANGNKFTQDVNKEIKLPANASKEDYKAALAAQLAAEREQAK